MEGTRWCEVEVFLIFCYSFFVLDNGESNFVGIVVVLIVARFCDWNLITWWAVFGSIDHFCIRGR